MGMDGAFATIRGGGMKTFRPKRGMPPPEPTPEELELMGDASPRADPVVEDVMVSLWNNVFPLLHFLNPILHPKRLLIVRNLSQPLLSLKWNKLIVVIFFNLCWMR